MADYWDDTQNNDNTNDLSSQIGQGGDEQQQVSNQIASASPQPTPQMSYAPGQAPVGLINQSPQMSVPDNTPQDQGQQQDQTQMLTPENQKTFDTLMTYANITRDMFGLGADASDGKIGGGAIDDLNQSVNAASKIAPTGGEESGFIGKLMDGILNPKNASLTNLGANLIAGMFNQKYKQAASDAAAKSAEAHAKTAEASLMNARTAQEKQNLESAGAKAMGLINMQQAPIQYTNLLAERRARSGAK